MVVTDNGSEIVVLDTAGYGAVTIDPSASIVAPPGIHAAITATIGVAVTIDAGATSRVVLRGLAIRGGPDGILIHYGDAVISGTHVEDSGFDGIRIDPDAATSVQALVRDSVLARKWAQRIDRGRKLEQQRLRPVENAAATRNVGAAFRPGARADRCRSSSPGRPSR